MKRKNYMKKIVTVLAVATMLMSSLSACGKTEDTTTDKPAAEASVETEQTSEAAGTETVAETEAVAATEENTEGEDNRLEEGMEKVYTLIDAYNDLLSQHKYAEDLLQADLETEDDAELGNLGLTTADGNEIQTVFGYYSVLITYYFNYVNNGIKYGDGYSDFNELAAQIPDEKSIMAKYGFVDEGNNSENGIIMAEAVRVLPFLASCEAVHGTDLVETTEYVMGDYTSAYAIPLNCDGNTGLTAVFNADGNLMNICSSDDFDQYISSFPNGASE
ncbi:hypothetical protein [Roseburia inulinivorans]